VTCKSVADVTCTLMIEPKCFLVLLETAVMEIETLVKALHVLENVAHSI
jgi:hypothetical protein